MLRSAEPMLDEPVSPPALAPVVPAPRGPWGPVATLALGAAAFALYMLVQLAVLALFPGLLRSGSYGLAFSASTLTALPFGTLFLLAIVRRRGPRVRDYLGLHLPTARQALVAFALVTLFNLAYDQLTRLLHRPLVPDFMLNAYRTAHGLPWLYLAVVVAAPVFEELLFRGFLLPGLEPALGAVGAALLSSVAFALPHLQYDLFDMSGVFVLGLLFAGIRLRTGSTLLTITLHALTNLLATLEVAWVLTHPA